VLLPCAFLFAQTGVLDLVWLAFPIAELVAVVLGILFMVRIFRAQIRPLKEEQFVLEME
ncbi:MAG TPA: MATE family efflux transporter, partial [Erysipelotrichaceae bacterium]|nr:MATE family efflux transporter [Erysipelotrichaceae bacterium]